MSLAPNTTNTRPAATSPFVYINLDQADAAALLRLLPPAPRPHLVVNCEGMRCLRTLGVSHVVSELLVLHRSAARVWLRRPSPLLQRCLRLLRLELLFPVLAA